MKLLFPIFLLIHGLIHSSFLTKAPPAKEGSPVWPFDITTSWLLTPMGMSTDTVKLIGTVLALIATFGFVLSAAGWIGISFLQPYWVAITVISCIASILLLAIFWNNWFVMGPLIDIALLFAIYFKDLAPK